MLTSPSASVEGCGWVICRRRNPAAAPTISTRVHLPFT
ncbi:hypothetical protein BPORC_1742 [Bifidobacterium porcinum]|nr:hypothetical protein BPORC_1742 [Bifidobacterium porcinum]